jgi:hypothetical protein
MGKYFRQENLTFAIKGVNFKQFHDYQGHKVSNIYDYLLDRLQELAHLPLLRSHLVRFNEDAPAT